MNLTSYINYMRAEHKSENTIVNYVKYAEEVLNYVRKPIHKITTADLMDWQGEMTELSSATICLKLSAVKHLFSWLLSRGEIATNPAINLEAPAIHNKEKEYMSAKQVRAMINSTTNKRDRAILLLFANTGLRVSELCGITMKQWLDDQDTIKILGKGNKERYVYIGAETKNAINDYLSERKDNGTGLLFTSHGGEAIKTSNLSMTVKKYARMAGVPHWEEITNHSLRAAFATIQSENGTPVAEIRDMLGHSNIAVTSRYVKTNKEVLRNRMTTSLV